MAPLFNYGYELTIFNIHPLYRHLFVSDIYKKNQLAIGENSKLFKPFDY